MTSSADRFAGMQTQRLYWTEPNRARFEAQVIAVDPGDDDLQLVVLDRTAFFAEGGGQPADRGRLGEGRVVHVAERGAAIVHHVTGHAPAVGAELVGEVDLVRRRDHSCQHTAQHILSALALQRYGAKTVGFHVGADASSVDLELADPARLDLAELEGWANDVIEGNLEVETTLETNDGSAEFRTDRTVDEGELLRRVAIGDLVTSLCCGTHVERTGQIGLIKLGRTERIRQATRIEFFAGRRCLGELARHQRIVRELSDLASAGPDDLLAWATASLQEQKSLKRKVATLSSALAEHEAKRLLDSATTIGTTRLIRAELEQDMRGLKGVAQTLTEQPGVLALLATGDEGKGSLVFARADDLDVDVSALLRPAAEACGARGGGRPALAQAGGGDPTRLGAALDAAAASATEQLAGGRDAE